MRVLELFSGYGSQALALENLGIEFVSDISEIDKYAIQAYNQLHGETHNWGDITKIDENKLPYYDLITYSSPCQDFSTAGLQRGGDKGTGTRSSLLWECERIIRSVKPKYLLMENVKNLVGEKHKHNFIKWLNVLEGLGYQNFWQVLNAKDYGVPQNRERVFIVSILGGGQYLFPNRIKLEKKLKDILEPAVDEKYYLSDRFVNQLLKRKDGLGYKPCINGEIAVTLTTNPGQRNADNYIQEPFVVASRGRNIENPSDRTAGKPTQQRLEINKNGFHSVSPALMANDSKNVKVYSGGFRIRKLTPRECFRLMGVKDEQFDKLSGLSNTQLYKMAGNSIVVDVLMAIFKNLFLSDEGTKGQLTLF